MEVGAVKQAFNNELILLKKKLNQAKIQIIHKLTRKAKTLTEKKALDPLKEKFKKKAESAIKEVLILKKIKSRDLGKFIVTHTGTLQNYLNRPEVDLDKACARLLLHKVLQDKYNFIRSRFTDVPIKDLFMSRLERRKFKKEDREKQMEKKRGKKGDGNTEGDWDVEDAEMGDVSNIVSGDSDKEQSSADEDMSDDNERASEDDGKHSEDDGKVSDDENKIISDNEKGEHSKNEIDPGSDIELHEENEDSDVSVDSNELTNIGRFVKLPRAMKNPRQEQVKNEAQIKNVASTSDRRVENNFSKIEKEQYKTPKDSKKKTTEVNKASPSNKVEHKFKIIEQEIRNRQEKKTKDSNKNKNFNEKILQRKFKKDTNEAPTGENKIADPFFITSSGENYMSVAEPRQPDEVKEIHKQGNRKMRRAAMFGYVPNIRPRNDNYNSENPRSNKANGFHKSADTFVKENNRFNNNNSGRNNERSNFKAFKSKIDNEEASKPEKLHPSWEAKKRQSGILPFKGKKIVFDEG